MSKRNRIIGVLGGLVMALSSLARAEDLVEYPDYARWYFSPGIGVAMFEGDQPLEDGMMLNLRVGYDYSEWWTFEGGFMFAPRLDENMVGLAGGGEKSQAHPDAAGFDDTWMGTIYGDALFHFTRFERLDPYLAGGLGLVLYGEDLLPHSGRNNEVVMRGGGGVMYHLNDEWALRADGRLLITTDNTEVNAQADLGVVWTWGARVPPKFLAVDGPVDSDGDGIGDYDEINVHGTDPFNEDSDGDGLSDSEEIFTHKTDPLKPDSDFDLLSDGKEVLVYSTDPNEPDTDAGGVSDGHEVLEDGTDPLDPADDLMRVELDLNFDYDKAVIKPEYFEALNVVARVLERHPESRAVIEGHADQLRNSDADYNRRLSQRRADAVLEYLVLRGNIDRDRLKAVGYGFDRPRVKPDLENGTPENRRVEVYIRGVDGEEKDHS